MGVTSSRGTFDVNRNANACPIMLPGRTVKAVICSRVAAYNTGAALDVASGLGSAMSICLQQPGHGGSSRTGTPLAHQLLIPDCGIAWDNASSRCFFISRWWASTAARAASGSRASTASRIGWCSASCCSMVESRSHLGTVSLCTHCLYSYPRIVV